jgi:flagellar protein FliO/FliZ
MGFGTIISSILAVVLSLVFVLGLAWGAIWLLKKLQDRQLGIKGDMQDPDAIRFLRSMPLGQRERVALIELDGQRLLLGVTAGGISLLARFDDTHPAHDPRADDKIMSKQFSMDKAESQ